MVGASVAGPASTGAGTAEAAVPAAASSRVAQPLTNLAHLDWLGAQVTPPAQSGHNAHLPAYDPTTGRPVDGIEADGRVNKNAGVAAHRAVPSRPRSLSRAPARPGATPMTALGGW